MIPYKSDSLVGDSRQQLLLQNVGRCMGLKRMPHGLSRLNVRIWLWYPGKNYVIDLLDSGSYKRSYIAEFSSAILNGQEQIAIHREWKNITPRSGWDSLFLNIEGSGILRMNGGKAFKQLRHKPTESTYVQFEIAMPSGYHFIEYLQPDFYRYVNLDSRNLHAFLDYLNGEFGINAYQPADDFFLDPKDTLSEGW